MAAIMADGKLWAVTQIEESWVFEFSRKNSIYPTVKRFSVAAYPTIELAAKALEAAEMAAYIAKNTPKVQAPRPAVLSAPLHTAAGRKLEKCPRCGATGYAGSYPFSTGYSRLCDDCGA